MSWHGVAEVNMGASENPDILKDAPLISFECAWKRRPINNPNALRRCIIDFYTIEDITATILADPNVVTLISYEEEIE